MANKLIKNVTDIFYTVKINDSVSVFAAEFYGGEVRVVHVSRSESKVQKFRDIKQAEKVAWYIGGYITKHTRTEVITEVTEELKKEEEK